jgi:hypothetical protein
VDSETEAIIVDGNHCGALDIGSILYITTESRYEIPTDSRKDALSFMISAAHILEQYCGRPLPLTT